MVNCSISKKACKIYLICGMISSSRSLASSFAEAFAFTIRKLLLTLTETRHENEFTKESHDIPLALPLFDRFALEVDEPRGESMNLMTIIS